MSVGGVVGGRGRGRDSDYYYFPVWRAVEQRRLGLKLFSCAVAYLVAPTMLFIINTARWEGGGTVFTFWKMVGHLG